MIVIEVYAWGAGVRARLHFHPSERGGSCDAECEEYSHQRAYSRHGAQPREIRQDVARAVEACLADRTIGHVTFGRLLGDQLSLDLDVT